MSLRAIPSFYNGFWFRSRKEARWAVFWDALGVKYFYEDEAYDLDGLRYLPDFWLPEYGHFVEVKGSPPSGIELQKARRLAQLSEKPVLLLHGQVGPEVKGLAFLPSSSRRGSSGTILEFRTWAICGECGLICMMLAPPPDLVEEVQSVVRCQNASCGGRILEPASSPDPRAGALLAAYGAARSARFDRNQELIIRADSQPEMPEGPRIFADVLEQAMEEDRAFFAAHPQSTFYLRDYRVGEFFPILYPLNSRTLVKQIAPGIRYRTILSNGSAQSFPGYDKIVRDLPAISPDTVAELTSQMITGFEDEGDKRPTKHTNVDFDSRRRARQTTRPQPTGLRPRAAPYDQLNPAFSTAILGVVRAQEDALFAAHPRQCAFEREYMEGECIMLVRPTGGLVKVEKLAPHIRHRQYAALSNVQSGIQETLEVLV